jgi:subtilisin family serine protease
MTRSIYAAAIAALLVLVHLLCATPVHAQTADPRIARASDGPAQVDPVLTAQLTSDGSARMLIYFRAQPNFRAMPSAVAEDRDARGQWVVSSLRQTAEASQRRAANLLASRGIEHQAFWVDNIIVVPSATAQLVDELRALDEIALLRASPEIVLYEPERIDPAQAMPRAAESSLVRIKVPDTWNLGITGTDIVVASIDTGVRFTHNALVGKYRGNLGGGSFDHNYNWWDPYTPASAAPEDTHDHGSHVTGTMVGDDGNGNQIGAAPGAKWIACKGFRPSATDAGLLSCAQFFAAPTNLAGQNPNPALRPHIVNNSWGDCGRSYDGWYQGVIDAWHAAGIYPVFSAGNASNCSYSSPPGLNTVGNPARYGNVTAVGSTGTSNGLYANHSNWGPTDNLDTVNPEPGHANLKPQVLAPGVSIRSSLRGSDTSFGLMTGTSMSGPAVAGVIALVWQAAPCLIGDYATTETVLESTATPIAYSSNNGDEGPGNVPNHAAGWGEVDALAAAQFAALLCDAMGTLAGTVTDADTGLPLEGALVRAYLAPPPYFNATTSASGTYSRTVPAGSLTVEVSLYGYTTQVFNDVEIIEDETTVLDASLTPLTTVTMSGSVTDATTGWPVYARVEVTTMPGTLVWADPATGAYSVPVFADEEHSVTVTAWSTFYGAQTRTVGPFATAATENFTLEPSAAQPCAAPWTQIVFGPETFSATAMPDGWSVVDNLGAGRVWRFDNPGNRSNLTGGTGNFAIVDSDNYGSGNSQDTELRMPVLDLSSLTSATLEFKTDFRVFAGSQPEVADVDVSLDGTNWTNVWRRTADYRGPRTERVDLSAYAGQSAVRVRFRYYNATWEWWWQVDDVQVLSCGGAPAGWGVVYGNVSDANTNADLTGALLTTGTFGAIAQTTPDASQGNAFYVMYLPGGQHTIITARDRYSDGSTQVTVNPGAAVRADFSLDAGVLTPAVASIVESLPAGSSALVHLPIENTGGASLGFSARRSSSQSITGGPSIVADTVKGEVSSESVVVDRGNATLAAQPAGMFGNAAPHSDLPWQTVAPVPTGLSRPAGAAVDGRFYVMGGESSSNSVNDTVHVFDVNTAAWTVGPPLPVAVSNACAASIGSLIHVAGGNVASGDASTHLQVLDTTTGIWTLAASDPLPLARVGASCASLGGRLYVFGGTNTAGTYQNNAWAYDPSAAPGSRWSTLANTPILGAWGGAVGIGDRVFWAGMRNTTADLASVYAYVPATNAWVTYPNLQQTRGGAALWARGSELLVGGGGWTTFRTSVEVYDTALGTSGTWGFDASLVQGRRTFASASAGGMLFAAAGWAGNYLASAETNEFDADLPWLSLTAMEGELDPAQQWDIGVILDAGAVPPGIYTGSVRFATDTPYPTPGVPVTLTVVVPPPTLTSVSPSAGPVTGGTEVTLTGTGFQIAGTTTVSFGGNACSDVVVIDSTSLTCSTPAAAAAGAVAVTVTNPDSQFATAAGAFTYTLLPPTLSSVSPSYGVISGGTLLTLEGTEFQTSGSTTVNVGDDACIDVIVVDASTITCRSPAAAGPGIVDVEVVNPDGQSVTLSLAFEYRHTPAIVSVTPATGWTIGGTEITIEGDHFDSDGTVSVTIGGQACDDVTVVDAETITCTTPSAAAAGAVDVTVTNPDGLEGTLSAGFTYVVRPDRVFANGFESN